MKKEKVGYKLVVGLGIMIIALSFANYRRKQATTTKQNELLEWPKFVSKDISGRSIRAADFAKHVRYLQFVSFMDDNNIELLKRIYTDWSDTIDIIVIVKDYRKLLSQIQIDIAKAVLIQDGYEVLYDKFKSTKYGKHYLFNKKNERVFSAENYIPYDAGVKRYLQLAVNNRQFHISEFIEEKQNIKKMPIFDQIRTYMEQENRDHLLIGMIYSFCESCASGLLIETLKELNSTIGWKKAVIIILSMEYTEADIEILKSQFRIDFPILIASRGLNERWREIIEEYSKNDVNNIVFAVDRSGNVVRVLDQICQSCTRTFWKWIYNQQRKKGEAVDSR